jgi:hypothetical protein
MQSRKVKELSDEQLVIKLHNCEEQYVSLTSNMDGYRKLRLLADLTKSLEQLRAELDKRKST